MNVFTTIDSPHYLHIEINIKLRKLFCRIPRNHIQNKYIEEVCMLNA